MRRAERAPAVVEPNEAADAAALRRLLLHELNHAKDPSNRRFTKVLYEYRHTLNSSVRGHVVRQVSDALHADGGRFLRVMARAHDSFADAAASAVAGYVVMRAEHGIEAASANSMLLRACLASAISDALLESVVRGVIKADGQLGDLPRLAAALATSARLDLLTALALQKEADVVSEKRAREQAWPPMLTAAQQAPQGHDDRGAPRGEGEDGELPDDEPPDCASMEAPPAAGQDLDGPELPPETQGAPGGVYECPAKLGTIEGGDRGAPRGENVPWGTPGHPAYGRGFPSEEVWKRAQRVLGEAEAEHQRLHRNDGGPGLPRFAAPDPPPYGPKPNGRRWG